MGVRFPLSFKIGGLAAALVLGTCAAVWYLAVLRPALAERKERLAQYRQFQAMLGMSGAVHATLLTNPAIHPDLVYVVRRREGRAQRFGSIAHADRLAPLAPDLAHLWEADPARALETLGALDSGDRPSLVVKRVNIRADTGIEELELGFSTLAVDRGLRQRLAWSALVLGLSLCGAACGAIALGRAVARPVHRLAAAMERVGKGTLQPVAVESRDEVGLLARAFNEMVQGLIERERLKATLGRYVSEDVALRILNERSDLDLRGELREVTVLFLDIRGFTSLAERLPPREVVAMLNEYFEVIIEVIHKHHGIVNKFIGDAVMALFGVPFEVDDAPMRAIQAAVEIEQVVAAVNHRRKEAGRAVLSVGIGINTGAAVAGNIGSERRMEYTVIGDEVNLAQRLESLAREGEILISQTTFEKVRGRVEARPCDPVQVKGKTLPVWIFEVVGLAA